MKEKPTPAVSSVSFSNSGSQRVSVQPADAVERSAALAVDSPMRFNLPGVNPECAFVLFKL